MSALPAGPTLSRQHDIAAAVLSAERVHTSMLARLDATRGPTITLAIDEYIQIGLHMSKLWGIAREYHGVLNAGELASEDLVALNANIDALSRSAISIATILRKISAQRAAGEAQASETDPARGRVP